MAHIRTFLFVLLASCVGLYAQSNPWTNKIEPFKIAGNLYYVGTEDLASYLITTPAGHILINSTLEANVPTIQQNVASLGFRFTEVKYLLINHAHFDHCAGSALIKQRTGAQYLVMKADVGVVESGGTLDFAYGDKPHMCYTPTKVDRVLEDGDVVSLGGTTVQAHLTPGHTRGCTTWTLAVKDGNKTYNVVIVGGTYVNPEYKLVDNKQYPSIADDYRKCFDVLAKLPCDIFLGAHGSYFGMFEKIDASTKTNRGLKKKGKQGYTAKSNRGITAQTFVDPDGYTEYVAYMKDAFEEKLKTQQAPPRTIAISIDDLPFVNGTLSDAQQGTIALLSTLRKHNAPADVFVIGRRVEQDNEEVQRRGLIADWVASGHAIHNHSWSHPRYSTTTTRDYLADVAKGEDVVRASRQHGSPHFYRAPYNDLGGSVGKRDSLLSFLAKDSIILAPFTVEHADYVFELVYHDALKRGDTATMRRVGDAYLVQLDSAMAFAERLSVSTFDREIPQILLIHANHINAVYLDRMLEMLKSRGYAFVSMARAMKDPAYTTQDLFSKHWGVSWLHRWRVGLQKENLLKQEPEVPKWLSEEYKRLSQ